MNDKGQMEKTVNNIDFPSSCLERMRLFVLFVGLLIFVPVDAAAISKCRQAVGMAELFATSDLVAVVRYTRRNVRGRPLGVLSQGQAVRVESLNVSFVELLKKPYVTGFDQSTSQLIYLTPYLLKEN